MCLPGAREINGDEASSTPVAAGKGIVEPVGPKVGDITCATGLSGNLPKIKEFVNHASAVGGSGAFLSAYVV